MNGNKFTVIGAFAHGIVILPKDVIYTITGWILGIILLVLLGTGFFLSLKHSSKPMTEEDDLHYRNIRIIKWVFTIILFPTIGLHYLLFS